MRITPINASLSVNKTLANLLFLYIISILFTYPYGIAILEDSYARIPDLFAIAIGIFALAIWSLLNKSKFKLRPLLPIIPFLTLEVTLPILGGMYYEAFLSNSLSSMRVLLLYLPIGVCCCWLGISSSLKLDRRIDKLLRIAIIANLGYAIIQLAVYLGILSDSFLVSTSLDSFIADDHFREIQGLRIAGFFTNTTGLSVFGIVAMSYFLSKYKSIGRFYYLIYSMLALMLVILSTARAAYVGAVLIILFSILSSKLSKSIKTITIITLAVGLLLFVLGFYFKIDYEVFFHRFIRIREEGLAADYSWKNRVAILWPKVIAGMKDYPLGTLVPSYKIFRLIDSGYLTYYCQGKWLFIAGLLWFYLSSYFNLLSAKTIKKGWSVDFVYCLLIYIIPAMVTSNPMRSPVIIFALIYGLWFFSIEKQLAAKRFYWK